MKNENEANWIDELVDRLNKLEFENRQLKNMVAELIDLGDDLVTRGKAASLLDELS